MQSSRSSTRRRGSRFSPKTSWRASRRLRRALRGSCWPRTKCSTSWCTSPPFVLLLSHRRDKLLTLEPNGGVGEMTQADDAFSSSPSSRRALYTQIAFPPSALFFPSVFSEHKSPLVQLVPHSVSIRLVVFVQLVGRPDEDDPLSQSSPTGSRRTRRGSDDLVFCRWRHSQTFSLGRRPSAPSALWDPSKTEDDLLLLLGPPPAYLHTPVAPSIRPRHARRRQGRGEGSVVLGEVLEACCSLAQAIEAHLGRSQLGRSGRVEAAQSSVGRGE